VPYETGQPRYHDVAYGLGPAMQPLPAGSCDGTLLYGGRVCREVADRGLAEFFCSEGNCHSRAGQSLVLWGSSQMGAYNYIIRWEFHDDGTIEPVFVAAGVLQFGAVDHTHNVYWRLDLDIDDADGDSVEEFYRIVPAWSDGREGASGWTPLLAETFRANDLNTFRRWRVVDHGQTNAEGSSRSYEVNPNPADGNLRTVPEEGFSRGELFITKSRDAERFVSTETSDLLSSYLNGESVTDTDVVLWYVQHMYHLVRDEDEEFMPAHVMRYEIRPNGFFDHNPTE
jgi:primary-amine oxidase